MGAVTLVVSGVCVALTADGCYRLAKADGVDWSLAQLPVLTKEPPLSANATTTDFTVPNFIGAWQAVAAQARGNQPAWSSPLVTTTGMLEQRFRFDMSEQRTGNGANTTVLDGGRGLDLIVSPSNEIQIAAPPYDFRSAAAGKAAFDGFGDWAFMRFKQQLAAAPTSRGDYFVTVWLQVQAPIGVPQLTSGSWTYLPTLAFGKGWGDFDIQATVGGVLSLGLSGCIAKQSALRRRLACLLRPSRGSRKAPGIAAARLIHRSEFEKSPRHDDTPVHAYCCLSHDFCATSRR